MEPRRVVITAVGAVTPLGLTAKDLWEGLIAGKSGIGRIAAFDPSAFPCQLAGEAPPFNIRDYVPKSYRKATKLMSRDIELSVVAADEAVRNSGLISKAIDPDKATLNPTRTAIDFGAGLICCELPEIAPCVAKSITDGRFDIRKWGGEGMEALTPLWLLKYLPNMLPCHIGIIHDIQGPSNTITCGEVSAHIAMTEAAEMIARGDAEVALAGGGEAKVNPVVLLRQCLLKRSAVTHNDEPQRACRPFDASADGGVFGEGAGVLVLEEYNHAAARKASLLAELVGGASSASRHTPYEHLDPEGRGLETAIRSALAQAGITPDQLDLVIPQGVGIACDDRAEAAAIQRVLGDAVEQVSVWPIKPQVSHTGAAAGAIDVIAAALAIKHATVGRAVNFETPAEGVRLRLEKQPVQKKIRYALCCGYSFGGQTAAVVLRNIEESA